MKQVSITKRISQKDSKSVELYFSEISKYEPLSSEEERELSYRIQEGDELALQKLVESNLKFVISVAKIFQSSKISLLDLIEEGNMGLIKAAGKFDGDKGYRFISYAVWWIRQSIMKHIAEFGKSVRMPMNRFAESNKIYSFIDDHYKKTGDHPSDDLICQKFNIKMHEYSTLMMCNKTAASFNEPINTGADGTTTLLELTPSDFFGNTDDDASNNTMKEIIKDALSLLNPRERDILKVSYGLSPEDSYEKISERYGIGRERVKQLENYALIKLRHVRGIKNLMQYL